MREAVRRIGERARVRAVSAVYETDPVGGPEQPAFYNAAIAVEWKETPLALLALLQRVEADLGRTRELRWGPRTIDLDVLWIDGGLRIEEATLTVPHPRLSERAFAIVPLLEVAPHAPYACGGEEGGGVRRTAHRLTGP